MEEHSLAHISPKRHYTHTFAALALASCSFPVVVGDSPQSEPLASSSTGADEPLTGGPPTTSGTTHEPAACGDGVVGDGEACDDGNTELHDGCDPTCARTGVLQWTHIVDSPNFGANLAVDNTGRIVIVGKDSVMALNPAGELLWRKSIADTSTLTDVAIDDAGRIYVGGVLGIVHGLDPDGDEIWRNGEQLGPDDEFVITGLAVTATALYSLGREEDAGHHALVLRRHDLATGAVAWTSKSPAEFQASPEGLTISGANIVVAGMGWVEPAAPNSDRPLLAVFDDAGAQLSFDLGDEPGRFWTSVAPVGDGGVVVAGLGPTADFAIRRLDAAFEPLWTHYEDNTVGTWAHAVAVGPDDAIAIAGRGELTNNAAIVRRIDGDGDSVWTSSFENPDKFDYLDAAVAVAFGPGFIVALGHAPQPVDGTIIQTWVRRFAID